MSTPYVGEVRLVGFNYAPASWSLCNGALLSIANFNVLYNLIGTTYGGDGVQNFAVPDLRGRIPISPGGGYALGSNGGVETVTVSMAQFPTHTHAMLASPSTANNVGTSAGNFLAGGAKIYSKADPSQAANAAWLTSTGGSQPHNNLQPYQVLNWIIALEGIYPTQ